MFHYGVSGKQFDSTYVSCLSFNLDTGPGLIIGLNFSSLNLTQPEADAVMVSYLVH